MTGNKYSFGSVNVVPRTDPPPTECDEVPNTFDRFLRPLVMTEAEITILLTQTGCGIALLVRETWDPEVFVNKDSTPFSLISRSSTMPEFSCNPQQEDEDTSLVHSRKSTRSPRRPSY